ncbi:MAG: helix-turn-helix domain-containing protein [Pseudonocardiaceae bacterium]
MAETEQLPSRMGVRIAELRKIHGHTQQALAARANVSYSLLRKVERGNGRRHRRSSRLSLGRLE